ncbi:MAG: glycogen synthase [Actinomyces sp.]|jgi:starch synthase|nr:glycogen synthase [Actinomyces sp.]MCI1641073.1 glycogen synthase [Actinomyces sp.]MCI1661441.1 glycogen synthase [Actinomyces sp.]MCI1690449.1 glycogen synthase [Actinomyces sp.]MCI1787090.1 glycogen synthase [Actinomyces sp.]MCI1829344.1 glycogen synthase [Actinomyces sp.]
MRVDILTREYPPHVYGGAGVHVTELARVLRPLVGDLRVHAFDGPREAGGPGGEAGVSGYPEVVELSGANAALRTLGVDLEMVGGTEGADLVHSHTWYANMAGHLASLMGDVPHVVTAHSLEPLRPWKAEQLGGGYRISSFVERTAYEGAAAVVAVSRGMREDVLRAYPAVDPDRVHVIPNGIDLARWRPPRTGEDRALQDRVLAAHGIDRTRPTVAFVGRITRQKGLPYFLRAARRLPADVQIVLCAGAPDTPEIAAEVGTLVARLREERTGVVLIPEMLPQPEVAAILDAADVFVTPSVYEPQGIVNLEAMALGLPVVGTDTGGIPDCVVDGVTGYLVPIEQKQDGTGTPIRPRDFEAAMAERLIAVLADPERARAMGRAGMERARDRFSWTAIAEATVGLYRKLLGE